MYIFHIDVNSAYLSWEAVRRLENGSSCDLRTIPSVVGGDPRKRSGIVLAKSILAKKYGIITGETLWEARSKCPDLVVVPPDYELYVRCSNAMYDLLSEFSPVVQRYSVDECFLDYVRSRLQPQEVRELAGEMKSRFRQELGFTVNIGISTNKLLAKMASGLSKPDQVHTLFPEEIPEKMWPLPVGDLFMVGKATRKKLHCRNIKTIGQLARSELWMLEKLLKGHGRLIYQYANGIDYSSVCNDQKPLPLSIGNSTTTSFDVTTADEAEMVLLALTERASMRLRKNRARCLCVSVSIRNSLLQRYSHQMILEGLTDITGEIFDAVKKLFSACWKGEPLRQVGVRLSQLESSEFYQLTVFDDQARQNCRKLDTVIDSLREKYGSDILYRSCFAESGISPVQGGVQDEEYPMMSSYL